MNSLFYFSHVNQLTHDMIHPEEFFHDLNSDLIAAYCATNARYSAVFTCEKLGTFGDSLYLSFNPQVQSSIANN